MRRRGSGPVAAWTPRVRSELGYVRRGGAAAVGAAILAGSAAAVVSAAEAVMTHREAAREARGLVVAAPHEGFDLHTGAIARQVAEELGWGLVVAEDYRATDEERWFDVNRPTQRRWTGGERGDRRETDAARRIYEQYQARLYEAGRVDSGPLALLVELHGNSRRERIGGRSVPIDVIELATTGFSTAELRRLGAAYERLAAELVPPEHRVALAMDELDPTYDVRGEEVRFYYRASGARETGSLRPSRTRRALHFELPRRARGEEARDHTAELLARLLGAL